MERDAFWERECLNNVDTGETQPLKNDITFVVCGKIVLTGRLSTVRCLRSIRDNFPESKIILSTWADEPVREVSGLCDEVVLSDPGECPVKFSSLLDQKRPNTVNVQQVTGHAGLSRVRTGWAVKTRTDFVLRGDAFLRYYRFWDNKLTSFDQSLRIFKRRVLAPWIFTKDPECTDVSYQLSDFFQFGTTEDLSFLWDGHQEADSDLCFFSGQQGRDLENPEKYNHRFSVEQCFFLNVIKKAEIKVKLPRWYCDRAALDDLPRIKRVYASNILLGTLHELQLLTRWEREEPVYRKDMFISMQTLARWYLEEIDPENKFCAEFMVSEPEPCTARWTLARKTRMTLRKIPLLRDTYRYSKARFTELRGSLYKGKR